LRLRLLKGGINKMANRKFGWHSGKVHCKEITVGVTPALGATDQIGVGTSLVTTGTGRNWAAGIFAGIVQGTTKNVSGYLTAAEFEVKLSAVSNVSEWAVMTLNSWDNNTVGSYRTYLWFRDYGSLKMNSLIRFSDASIETTSKASLLSTAGALASTHTIRMLIGTTPYWILVNNVGP
jgi:hypothetical protein